MSTVSRDLGNHVLDSVVDENHVVEMHNRSV